ncbi:CBS domain-containing protein [Tranquillimonas alkanivorans]|uniref:CBS domain-containing protein n=1 Tax=Tranquillimonas alkanivorans TaxID=441119 RepID=A0A1I5WKV4_9RHOB|nr:CBS domain-containing protein [Tranquillimonas alkanivorans]SFQ20414.1 CBS domain-containing protein [Tranquillimonas alkanivorans]
MDISSAMHKSVDWADADTPVSEIARMMKTDDVGAIPVGKDDRLIGMITDRDIAVRVVAEGRDPKKVTAEKAMTPGIIYCQTHQSVEDAIHLMEQRQIRRLPVLDENKRMVGMLSLGDISHAVARELAGEAIRSVSAHHS